MRRAFLLFLLLAACHDQADGGGAGARDRIRAVGSSTVYPFTAAVAERYAAADPAAAAPVIESTGTGAGIKLFCGGVGAGYPDIAGASRRMRLSEYRLCVERGVREVIELPIGLDGIAFAEARRGPPLRLTPATLYRALGAEPDGVPNASQRWADIDARLPATPIRIYGPPATSGTRDALADLVLARGCIESDPAAAALARATPAAFRARCTRVREDGAYIDAGENDALIVQKLVTDPTAVGVFGYATLEANRRVVRGVAVDGIRPDYASIATGRYPGARTLYLYVKKAHLAAVPGLAAFLKLYAGSWGPGGPLVRRGLIAAPAAIRDRAARTLATAAALDPRELG